MVLPDGIDPQDLAQTGWGVIFAQGNDPALEVSLRPLLRRRQDQAGSLFRRLVVDPSKSARDFLWKHGVSPGVVNPRKLPYYLLIVGGPESIPFSFQHQLSISHAVGRISFETQEDCARYASTVIEAEEQSVRVPRRATFFAVQNADDFSTSHMATRFVAPLVDGLSHHEQLGSWTIEFIRGSEATKSRLNQVISSDSSPEILLVSSHGAQFRAGHRNQERFQGAIVCQDWPGPKSQSVIDRDHYYCADDVPDDAKFHGLIAILLSDFSGGTPVVDRFLDESKGRGRDTPEVFATRPFISRLAQRLLNHPKGGALAVVARIGRSWNLSFSWSIEQTYNYNLEAFKDSLTRLIRGHRIGYSISLIYRLYASLAVELAEVWQEQQEGTVSEERIAMLWAAQQDARNFVLLGDPAVKINSETMLIEDRLDA